MICNILSLCWTDSWCGLLDMCVAGKVNGTELFQWLVNDMFIFKF